MKASRYPTVITVLACLPAPAFASDFYALIVVFIAFGISAVLLILALIGIVFVVDKRYREKAPKGLVGTSGVLLLVGIVLVLDESAHMNSSDLVVLLGALLVCAALAIVPPLLQYTRAKR